VNAHDIITDLRGRDREGEYDCDGCSGRFAQERLHPTSGDWWLCDKCYDDLMKHIEKERPKP
jgi:predicted SprT family Zn-dependent metalloprotease